MPLHTLSMDNDTIKEHVHIKFQVPLDDVFICESKLS